ncbi:putative phospholipase A1-IIgamma-like [Capsicum annuum]|uniref:Uncharacterized protein n=1 Tax=Capsicum annuum TaxID=4072 RepID=A0A1U8FKM1_CAPAN|nr:IgA receptor isoform X1 [Capsicum annuum]XP_016559770.1 IgA receptor isoform X1 [Capsicum annuum]XP_016559771.1 IgA receptor isoform X1 [Capsicum annuum]XP_016559772.1 IgA receptor isoform X1 [Capsicum annuum]XP_016559773.1 IgA receptor isoform X1 [Capsicum annuum]XP_047262849.1 IgA receptor isoform X1 [Capsicum annuum]XP_047262850.1 IgA receptor isoform X1 [Capsicum annuum]KAF3622922.1 putative phospholipase A1-IIgamma-like [Capsicum annuum]KAF3684161.1 putative phospholipase A1-IIgamma
MEIITASQNSNTHKENESLSSKMAELEKEKEAALSKISQLEREGESALSKIVAVKKKKQAALFKIYELEKEKERTVNKVALLEREGKAAFSKIAVLETEKQAASSKIEELEKEKEDAARKIGLLEKELEAKEEKFGLYTNAQLQKEVELRTKFEVFKRHTNAEREIEKDAAMSKIAMLETELEIKEVRAYKQAIRALREIQVEDKEPREKMKELTITMQKLTEERNYWETLAKGKESETAELVEARKEIIRVLSDHYSPIPGKIMTYKLWNSKEDRKATLSEAICLMGEKLKEAKIKDTGFVKVDQLKPGTKDINLIVKVLNTNVVVDKNQNNRKSSGRHTCSQPRITRVAESLVGDETGSITFTARNEQVDLMEPGSILLLYGAEIQMYRGSMRLAVERSVQIIIAEPVEFVVCEDNNMSLTEYELVDVED